MNIGNAGNRNDGADGRLVDFHFMKTVKLIQLADPHLSLLFRLMSIDDNRILVDLDAAVVHFSYGNAAHIFIVVNGADKHLRVGLLVSLGRRNILDDCLEQGHHVLRVIGHIQLCVAVLCRGKHKGAIQLLVGSVQIHKQLQHFVDDLVGTRLRPIDFVDAHNNRQIQIQRLHQHKLCLGHSALKRINHKNDTVDHF